MNEGAHSCSFTHTGCFHHSHCHSHPSRSAQSTLGGLPLCQQCHIPSDGNSMLLLSPTRTTTGQPEAGPDNEKEKSARFCGCSCFTSLPICVSVCMPACLSVCLSVCLSDLVKVPTSLLFLTLFHVGIVIKDFAPDSHSTMITLHRSDEIHFFGLLQSSNRRMQHRKLLFTTQTISCVRHSMCSRTSKFVTLDG